MILALLLTAQVAGQDTRPPGSPAIPRHGVTRLACDGVLHGGAAVRFGVEVDSNERGFFATFDSDAPGFPPKGKAFQIKPSTGMGEAQIGPEQWVRFRIRLISGDATRHNIELYRGTRAAAGWGGGPLLNEEYGVAICDVRQPGAGK